MEWIKVKDRLPEFGEEVLLACVGNRFGTRSIYIGYLDNIRKSGPVFIEQTSDDDDLTDNNKITHWMPLPDLPDDKEK
jgi:hypothetical protein